MNNNEFPDALPTDYRLHWYVLDRVLGQGGFGITYVARDTNLDTTVAIKEYLPVDVATRRADSSVRSRTDDQAERYRGGLERFIREARTLARFDHANIVRVHSVFEHNGTAYMVMRFEKGETLAAVLERRQALPEAELKRVLFPILDGLDLVHGAGFIHRDIKPDNILIREDGSPVLLDFGSARYALGQSRTVTILVAPGYAPIEQYYDSGESQGPWTDIYGLGATCYRAITGHAPMDAIARSKGKLGSTQEMLLPAVVAGNGRYSDRFLKAVDSALEFSEKDRPQSIPQWRSQLAEQAGPPKANAPSTPATGSRSARPPWVWAVGGGVAVIALILVAPLLARIELPGTAKAPEPVAAATPKSSENVEELRRQIASLKAEQTDTQARLAAMLQRAEDAEKRKSDESEKKKAAEAEKPKPAVEKRKVEKAAPVKAAPEVVAVSAPAAAPAKPVEIPPPVTREPPPPPPKDPLVVLKEQAERNDGVAMVKLGDLHLAGTGVERSDQEAYRLFRRAADAGNAEAQLRLGDLYSKGRGVPQNNFQAYVWYAAAARSGNSAAKAGADRTAASLQAAEVQQAKKLVDALGKSK